MSNVSSSGGLFELKIDITTKNDSEFQDIASLVDKPEFLKDVRRIRNKLNLKKLLTYSLVNIKTNSIRWYFVYIKYCSDNPNRSKLLNVEVSKLIGKYKRPFHRFVIIQAILFGRVEYLYSPLVQIFDEGTKFNLPVVAIVPTQRTTDKEVRHALKKVKTWYRTGSLENKLFFQPKYCNLDKPHQFISTQREWYWMRLSGMKYREIADEWNNLYPTCKPTPDEDRVIKDIKAYRALLEK